MRNIKIEELKKVMENENGFTYKQRLAIANVVKVLETNDSLIVRSRSCSIDRQSYLRELAQYCTWLVMTHIDTGSYLRGATKVEYSLIDKKLGYVPKYLIEEIWNVLEGTSSPYNDNKYFLEICRICQVAQGLVPDRYKISRCFGEEIFACLQILSLITEHFS